MNDSGTRQRSIEVKPEVVFLWDLLQELAEGEIQIPRFQRAYVWRQDQMTDLLDSINSQYPVGSILVWETDEEIATLDKLGPFQKPDSRRSNVGYVLDGHQRLMTLAGALLPTSGALPRVNGADGGQWEMFWNARRRRFQHWSPADSSDPLFPLTSLLDTIEFLDSVERLRAGVSPADGARYIDDVSALARTFQSYRVPVIRIRHAGLSEAVEIFARLNSRGQSMTPDQMVSALTFRQGGDTEPFDLAAEIDGIVESLAERDFGEVERGTILRAILANLDEDIYRTDWTKLAGERREDLQRKLAEGVGRTKDSIDLAVTFLRDLGVSTSRLLPYGLQLVLLSAFFDRRSTPSAEQRDVLRRWFWVSSFSAWFGGANPSRISALIREFRDELPSRESAVSLRNFDLSAEALPYPLNFDLRSARTRTLLLVMLTASPEEGGVEYGEFAVAQLARNGPAAVGHVFDSPPREFRRNPANRMFRAPTAPRGGLAAWLATRIEASDVGALSSVGVSPEAGAALVAGDASGFLAQRQAELIRMEATFQLARGVTASSAETAVAPVDTE